MEVPVDDEPLAEDDDAEEAEEVELTVEVTSEETEPPDAPSGEPISIVASHEDSADNDSEPEDHASA